LKICWLISYGGWDFIPNLGGTVAEDTPTKVSCYSWNIEQLLDVIGKGNLAVIVGVETKGKLRRRCRVPNKMDSDLLLLRARPL